MKTKLLFVTFDKSPLDCTGWSGTPNSIFSQLMGKYEIDIFVISRFCSLSAAAGYVYESVLLRKRNLFYLSEAFAKKASAQVPVSQHSASATTILVTRPVKWLPRY